MVVTFRTKAYANITMAGESAIRLLKLMGHSGTVPSAIRPKDIPAALEWLRAAVAVEVAMAADAVPNEDEELDDAPVSLKNRAFPLVELLEAAIRENASVRWDEGLSALGT
jgi:hypothetical protein